jgi:hypothetical protein
LTSWRAAIAGSAGDHSQFLCRRFGKCDQLGRRRQETRPSRPRRIPKWPELFRCSRRGSGPRDPVDSPQMTSGPPSPRMVSFPPRPRMMPRLGVPTSVSFFSVPMSVGVRFRHASPACAWAIPGPANIATVDAASAATRGASRPNMLLLGELDTCTTASGQAPPAGERRAASAHKCQHLYAILRRVPKRFRPLE